MTNSLRYSSTSRITALLGCCIFFALLLTACENTQEELNALSKKRIAVEEAKFIESYLSQGGKMKARLTAPVMNRYQTDSPYIEFPNSLHVDFYNDSLKVESQLNAKYGRYRETEQRVFLRDSVTVFNQKKDTLKSKELWWDQNKEIFYTDKDVEIHQPDKIIYGKGLEADQSFNWYLIKEITGQVLVPKGGFGAAAVTDSTASPAVDSTGGRVSPPPLKAPDKGKDSLKII
ncbi:LPS export ABC transporter periplasmic protein LptC [Flavihumibacter sp. CACIAM 22H1]|uniref:LPS export ABC transporter periplasmic protein LptC n=1 Tax=Flavihumibacter sp. CACIAM 22H1 TaxID=1812911 RepID=UPI000A8F2095|nr:LPS export ABC transporter periplasmic protein LptC [Flavihumibacter sp. CACIAM 22H1]